MKPTNTFAKLFSSVSTLTVVASVFVGGAALGQVPWYTVLEQAPNPAVVTDAALRLKIVDSGFPWRIQDIGTGIEMLLIPSGIFQMGASPGDNQASADETPAHQVTLTKAFYLGKTEVTQAQWLAIMGRSPSLFIGGPNPVERVSWNDIATDAQDYQCFNTRTGFRLPTEAEWEYAYRGGTTTAFHSMPGYPNGTNDDSLLGNIAWFKGNNGALGTSTYGTKPVAGKAANAFGLYDMSGNVWEWCNDWYNATYYISSPSTDPVGPSTGDYRVTRGGSWEYGSSYCRSSSRGWVPNGSDRGVGFRVAKTASFFWSISGVLPVSGPSTGGTAIRINGTSGTNFPNPPVVTIGGVAATDVVWISPTLITAVTPAGTPGMAVVGVSGVSAESFYYRPSCDGDLDNNGTIDSSDLGLMLVNYGNCYESAATAPQEEQPLIMQTVEPAKSVPKKK
jgi:formylglycine-generating enzyme required for sulfatase activity